MFSLKTLDLRAKQDGTVPQGLVGAGRPSARLRFWIAYADFDGFRIDAAKHMGTKALRTFCDSIREFAQSIGKERFLLVGEVSGGREHAWEVVEKTGLDAALGIEDVPGKLERMVERLRRARGLLLGVPQLGPGRPGSAPLVPQPGGDPGGRPRSGPQRQQQVAVLRRQPVPRPGVQRRWRCS